MKNKTIILIHEMLGEIEKAHNAHIVYAVESGSRAWGLASEYSEQP